MKLKNIILIISLVIIFLISSSMAYFSGSEKISNRLHGYSENDNNIYKYLRIETDENFQQPENSDIFMKDIKIKNTGNTDCFVRVRLEFSSSEYENISFFSYSKEKNSDTYIPAKDLKNYPPENWVYSDGFYYYKNLLPPNDSTESLIKWVKTVFPENIKDKNYHIFVYAEAIGAEISDSYLNAWA
ncbi:MAG: hypothetical protein IKS03_04955 [Ruminococcus sp.]|nr:hypothetical protein [Ruminococcus sp.]